MGVTQDQFCAAVLDARHPVPAGLLDGAGHAAGGRFAVYRNNVAVSLTQALQDGFPLIARLLGKENMDGLAGLFLRAHPPVSPLLMLYGDGFPEFLEKMDQLSHLGYLPDVARLDLALRQSYHAADAAPLPPERLAALPPEDLSRARLTLAPALRLIRSRWPLHDIWRFHSEDNAPPPRAEAQDVQVTRPEYDPAPHLLPPGGGACVAALMAGAPLGMADEAARNETPAFDLGAVLALLLSGGAITGLETEG